MIDNQKGNNKNNEKDDKKDKVLGQGPLFSLSGKISFTDKYHNAMPILRSSLFELMHDSDEHSLKFPLAILDLAPSLFGKAKWVY